MSKQTQALLASWARSFFAAAATVAAVQAQGGDSFDLKAILTAGAVAVLPVVQRYFNKNDAAFGKGSKKAVKKAVK